MQTQFDHLAAVLTAGLSRTVHPATDLSQANWDVLLPYILQHGLASIAFRGVSYLKELGHPMPPTQLLLKLSGAASSSDIQSIRITSALLKFSLQWKHEGKCPLGLGGVALAPYYPFKSMYGAPELVCIPLYREAGSQPEASGEQTLTVGPVSITIPDSAAGPFGGKGQGEHTAMLLKAFYSAPCSIDRATGLAVPNPLFLALYHLFTAQQHLLHTHLSLRMVIDWGAIVHHLGQVPDFDWALFTDLLADLGLPSFAKAITELAVRLTGVELPEGAAFLTAAEDDAMLLYRCTLSEGSGDEPDQGRFSRFIGVLRNSKKYSRFTELSPTKEAFRYLFS